MNGFLTSEQVYNGFKMASENLAANLELLNSINVFPVADRDTGFNMSMSMESVFLALSEGDTVTEMFSKASQSLIENGKGNSGTILTLFFSGFAGVMPPDGEVSAKVIADAFGAGSKAAWDGVANPKDGTILSVASAAALKAMAALEIVFEPADVVSAAAEGAFSALPLTGEQNPALKELGVVDSGALGFCMILDGFAAAFNDSYIVRAYGDIKHPSFVQEEEESKYKYCVEFVAEKPSCGISDFVRSELENIGDCLIPAEGGKLLKVHVHTDKPDAVFFIASLCGPVKMTKVDNMHLQKSRAEGLKVFLCKEALTADGIKSMGNEYVFCLEKGELGAFKSFFGENGRGIAPSCVYTSARLPVEVEDHLPRIRYFSDDESLLDYLFSEGTES